MNDKQTAIQTWDKLAQKYQDKFMYMDIYYGSYNLFSEAIANENATILEIGCGPGNITKYLLDKHPNYKILATDGAPSMVELAKINNPLAVFQVWDARTINLINKKFNAVLCGFCMPYLSKEECIQMITDCHTLLHDDGVLYFSVIENDYEKSELQTSSDGQHSMFVYYHQADYLQKVLDNCKFKTLHLLRINYEKSEGVFDTHLIFITRK